MVDNFVICKQTSHKFYLSVIEPGGKPYRVSLNAFDVDFLSSYMKVSFTDNELQNQVFENSIMSSIFLDDNFAKFISIKLGLSDDDDKLGYIEVRLLIDYHVSQVQIPPEVSVPMVSPVQIPPQVPPETPVKNHVLVRYLQYDFNRDFLKAVEVPLDPDCSFEEIIPHADLDVSYYKVQVQGGEDNVFSSTSAKSLTSSVLERLEVYQGASFPRFFKMLREQSLASRFKPHFYRTNVAREDYINYLIRKNNLNNEEVRCSLPIYSGDYDGVRPFLKYIIKEYYNRVDKQDSIVESIFEAVAESVVTAVGEPVVSESIFSSSEIEEPPYLSADESDSLPEGLHEIALILDSLQNHLFKTATNACWEALKAVVHIFW